MYTFIKTTQTSRCGRHLQFVFTSNTGWNDIAYYYLVGDDNYLVGDDNYLVGDDNYLVGDDNYLVGDDGEAYVGRGWGYEGSHTYGYNSITVAICAIGHF